MGSFRQAAIRGNTAPAARVTAPCDRQKILYDPRLIDALLRDHAELGELFAGIGTAGDAGNFGEARSLLITFAARLKAHVVVENVRFYDYLEQICADDPATARVAHTYRRKMTDIGERVLVFIRKYRHSAFTAADREQFAVDYQAVGIALEERFNNEEDNLYRLYRPF
jgi:hypothetical protein